MLAVELESRTCAMASASSSNNSGKGAAEEPEPEPEPGPPSASPSPSPSSSAAAPYDPREYQPPHPDDRGGADSGKATKKKGKSKAKAKAKGGADSVKSKAAEDDDGAHCCGNCDALDAKRKCKGCGVERYCNRDCQTVGCRRYGRVRTRWWGWAPASARRGEARAHLHTSSTPP